jgi:hypothetical protein
VTWRTPFYFGDVPEGEAEMSIEDVAALIGVPAGQVRTCVEAQRHGSDTQEVSLPEAWREQGRARYRAYVSLSGHRDAVAAAAFWRSMEVSR